MLAYSTYYIEAPRWARGHAGGRRRPRGAEERGERRRGRPRDEELQRLPTRPRGPVFDRRRGAETGDARSGHPGPRGDCAVPGRGPRGDGPRGGGGRGRGPRP